MRTMQSNRPSPTIPQSRKWTVRENLHKENCRVVNNSPFKCDNPHPLQSICCVLITVHAQDSKMKCYSRPTVYSNEYHFGNQNGLGCTLLCLYSNFVLLAPSWGSLCFGNRRKALLGVFWCSMTLNKHTLIGDFYITVIHTTKMKSFTSVKLFIVF